MTMTTVAMDSMGWFFEYIWVYILAALNLMLIGIIISHKSASASSKEEKK